MISFEDLLAVARREFKVLISRDRKSDYTQLVIGEMHYLPSAQCELLRGLIAVRGETNLSLLGKEGVHSVVPQNGVDTNRVLRDEKYMHDLLRRKINALKIFQTLYPTTVSIPCDSERLYVEGEHIDKRCQELFEMKKKKGWNGMTGAERDEYDHQFTLLKNVVLKSRSDAMVKNLFAVQLNEEIPLAVLVCGLAHVPFRAEYRNYSVLGMLNALDVNYIVATVPSAYEACIKKEPFDFYTKTDDTEVSPYPTTPHD